MKSDPAFLTRRDLHTIGKWMMVSLPKRVIQLGKKLLVYILLGIVLCSLLIPMCLFYGPDVFEFLQSRLRSRKRISLQ